MCYFIFSNVVKVYIYFESARLKKKHVFTHDRSITSELRLCLPSKGAHVPGHQKAGGPPPPWCWGTPPRPRPPSAVFGYFSVSARRPLDRHGIPTAAFRRGVHPGQIAAAVAPLLPPELWASCAAHSRALRAERGEPSSAAPRQRKRPWSSECSKND